jgi:hypothetical protein
MRKSSTTVLCFRKEEARRSRIEAETSFGKAGATGIRHNLDGIELVTAYGHSDHHSQTAWLGDAVCRSHRNPDWTGGLSRAFGDVHASHRRGNVGPRLRSLQEGLEVGLSVLPILRYRLAVVSGNTVLAQAPVCFASPVDVEIVVQGRETHRRLLLRQRCSPLLCR